MTGARQVTASELDEQIALLPGLIPAAVDARERRVTWLDLDGYHCYEALFERSVAAFLALRKRESPAFSAPLDAMPDLAPEAIQPGALIFHGGRCGSTLLAKSLARSRSTMVFSEAAPHNQIWAAHPDVALYRRLVTAMGRRRIASHRHHAIKFSSFNIVRFDFIRQAFPEARAVFLFREPGAMLRSFRLGPPAWMGRDTGTGIWESAEAAMGDFYRAALAVRGAGLRCLNYAELRSEALPALLKYFGFESAAADLRAMQSEFERDAKSGLPYRPGNAAGEPVSAELRELYDELKAQSATDWRGEI